MEWVGAFFSTRPLWILKVLVLTHCISVRPSVVRPSSTIWLEEEQDATALKFLHCLTYSLLFLVVPRVSIGFIHTPTKTSRLGQVCARTPILFIWKCRILYHYILSCITRHPWKYSIKHTFNMAQLFEWNLPRTKYSAETYPVSLKIFLNIQLSFFLSMQPSIKMSDTVKETTQ